jgi:hypothetical protein
MSPRSHNAGIDGPRAGVGTAPVPARPLIRIAACAACALGLVALGVGLVLAGLELASPSALWSPAGAFRAGLQVALLAGAGPACIGALGYWWLWRRGSIRWTTVLPLGACLGTTIAMVEPAFLPWGAGCGLGVAGLTHLLFQLVRGREAART